MNCMASMRISIAAIGGLDPPSILSFAGRRGVQGAIPIHKVGEAWNQGERRSLPACWTCVGCVYPVGPESLPKVHRETGVAQGWRLGKHREGGLNAVLNDAGQRDIVALS